MSIMCKIGSCQAKQGMCGHEKMMMFVAVVAGLGGIGHWVVHWF